MADTIRGYYPETCCTDCGREGVEVIHWGPLAPVGMRVMCCASCWTERTNYYAEHGAAKPIIERFYCAGGAPRK